MATKIKYITISDNAEVGTAINKEDAADALLMLTPEEAKGLLVQLTARMREANII